MRACVCACMRVHVHVCVRAEAPVKCTLWGRGWHDVMLTHGAHLDTHYTVTSTCAIQLLHVTGGQVIL